MRLQEALRTIEEFWTEPDWPFGQRPADAELARIQGEFALPLPLDLQEYITDVAPAEYFLFGRIGNPLEVYSTRRLRHFQDGYNFNSVTKTAIPGWLDHWFMLADEGADPVFVDLQDTTCRVWFAYHGAGSWNDREIIADSIGQFLLCAAAVHHALHDFTEEATLDNEHGFRLAPEPAIWLFPRMRQWAGAYYPFWCGDFDNA